ncbi:MAG: hypothetical protein RSA29_12340 [Clostridium sp.]|uniref:hypothetical protein n=1 Tax=Clostridium sp. TaxID=1506 RepID=UPI003074362E
MNNKKLNLYFFGEIGEYDCYNPAYVTSKEYAAEILYLIAVNEPFSISNYEIAKNLNMENDEIIHGIINELKLINAIEVKDNTYRIKFPVFLEDDVKNMESLINNIGEIIGGKIISMKDILYSNVAKLRCSKKHSNERLLYHIICDKVFDGTAFEFFEERNTFCTSKLQPGNRDYLIVAYENSKAVENHSNKLLCSSNNYRTSEFVFNSFGDSNGSRKDLYRFFRLTQKSIDNASPFHDLNISYNKVVDEMNRETANKCGELICKIISDNLRYNELSETEKGLAGFLEELEYVEIDDINNAVVIKVPVFHAFENKTVIKKISDTILNGIYPIVKDVFENFNISGSRLTSVRHEVDMKEIANELWHQIFGATNEYLVKVGFVATPHNVDGEGRYLRSFRINH